MNGNAELERAFDTDPDLTLRLTSLHGRFSFPTAPFWMEECDPFAINCTRGIVE